jgi:glycosyltransferase involved in cell wall biosynthesis
VIDAQKAGGVLILIPALNEEASVGGVIHEVRSVMPGAAVLVADDCSRDSTRSVALSAGADVLTLPAHLGLGGCVQAGYKLAFEMGFEYVIRVDGDGQHDPHDVPRILDALRTTGCQMVIGSRFCARVGNGHTSAPRHYHFSFAAASYPGESRSRSDLRFCGRES